MSQRGALYVFHTPAQRDAAIRRGNTLRLNGVDAELLSTQQVKKLAPADGIADRDFGTAVAISGDTIAVGAYPSWVDGDPGTVYIFERNHGGAGNWAPAHSAITVWAKMLSKLLQILFHDARSFHRR